MSNSTKQLGINTPISLIIPIELYDDWIKNDFPAFQKENRSALNASIFIDFSKCEWISPLPLLALIVEIMSYSEPNRSIEIDLGRGITLTNINTRNRCRTRKFLSDHGFFIAFNSREDLNLRFQFDENGTQSRGYTTKEDLLYLENILGKSGGHLLYGDSIVLPATVLEIPQATGDKLSETVRNKIQELLSKADTQLFKFKTEARKYRDVTLQTLTQILLELVENSAEHGYKDDAHAHVGIYVRVRQINNKDALQQRKKELANSSLLSHILLNEKLHQVEVFVLDVGTGLFNDIKCWNNDELKKIHKEKIKNPLQATANILFQQPLSRHDRKEGSIVKQRGKSTGLMHLHNILSHQNNSSRIITGHEWLAAKHPRPSGFLEKTTTTGGHRIQQHPIQGTFFHIGISFSEIPELDSQWFTLDREESSYIRKEIIKKFSNVNSRLSNEVINVRGGEGLKNVGARVEQRAKTASGTVIRVNRVAEKNIVNTMINSWIEGFGKSTIKKPLLYLCDLGRYQAIDILWVVKNLFNGNERIYLKNAPEETSIFLVTEDLCCTEIKFEIFRYPYKDKSENLYRIKIHEANCNISDLSSRLAYVLQELRFCDTKMLWDRINDIKLDWETNPILLENVKWDLSNEKVLPYYLNFSVLVQDRDAARYVRRSLRRVLALFPEANDYALDTLVESALHDAKKWLIRPAKETKQRVLIGSLSVTGNTLDNFNQESKIETIGVIDCIKSPYYFPSNNNIPHLAALLWDADLPTETTNLAIYQRVRKSDFIEPVTNSTDLFNSFYDDSFYKELETNHLIKLGHWCYGDRHSLLDFNAELAIEQSAASESGAIYWLMGKISELHEKHTITLAFPVGKQAYRLAHQVKSRIEFQLNLLPLSFFPRFAGGMTRLTPMVLNSAAKLSKKTGEKIPLVIFLDFGFITNRTLRHVIRQLHAVGFKEVRAMGLLNRSSAPAFDFERKLDELTTSPITVPETFWSWSIPILGTGNHCPLCSALPALARLRHLVEKNHVDLLPQITKISDDWHAKDISDFGEEAGLFPLKLNNLLWESIAPLFNEQGLSIKSIPNTSCILSSRIIEFLRATGDTEFPINIVSELLENNGSEHAVEILVTILLLTGSSFTKHDLQEYISILAKASIVLGTKQYEEDNLERRSRLLRLVSLLFSIQSSTCKLAVMEKICVQLSLDDINSAPELRVALIALTTDSDDSIEVEKAFQTLCLKSKNKKLIINYHAIKPNKGTPRESWARLSDLFGRSSSHSQQSILGHLLSTLKIANDYKEVLPVLERLASLLGQCDPIFIDKCLGVTLHIVIKDVQELSSLAFKGAATQAIFYKSIEQIFTPLSKKIHFVLKRFGSRAETVFIYTIFYKLLQNQTKAHGLVFAEDVVLSSKAQSLKWPENTSGYLPICGYTDELFSEIFSNIASKSISSLPPTSEKEFSNSKGEAKAWLRFDITKESIEQGITIVIVTALDIQKPIPKEYKPTIPGLFDFGIQINSRSIDLDKYFELSIRIPSLASIVENL